MKESYFTLSTLDQKAAAMLTELKQMRERHAEQVFHPERAALLVLDMQLYFGEADSHAFVPSIEAILPNVQRLIKVFGEFRRPIFFTRHLNTVADAGLMSAWWQDLIRPDSTASRLLPQMDVSKGVVIRKSRYDAFYETSLQNNLREHDVSQVVVAGVMTHLCCETTARSAFMRGFEVFFCVDGTATYNEAFHRAALLNLSHGFALPVLCAEIVRPFALLDHW